MTGETWRLGHRPALDGLRAVAVALVLLAHLHVPGFENAGAVGVGVFFTLSGFLIANLLLVERAGNGRVRLARFYGRRMRRLGPALLVAALLAIGIAAATSLTMSRTALIGALTYTGNYLRMGMQDGDPLLGHTWSLAIEEQFYLLWPLLLLAIARLSARTALLGLLVGCVLSLSLRTALWDGTEATAVRIYNGLDTRADGLLLGCALAIALHARPIPLRPPRWVWPLGLAAIAALAVNGSQWFMIVWTPALAGLATCAIAWTAGLGGARALAFKPMAWMGRRSYGLYLYHLPAFALAGVIVGDSWQAKTAVWLPLALALVALSWRYVERPIQSRGEPISSGRSSRPGSQTSRSLLSPSV